MKHLMEVALYYVWISQNWISVQPQQLQKGDHIKVDHPDGTKEYGFVLEEPGLNLTLRYTQAPDQPPEPVKPPRQRTIIKRFDAVSKRKP
jgi:hypothetical protein